MHKQTQKYFSNCAQSPQKTGIQLHVFDSLIDLNTGTNELDKSSVTSSHFALHFASIHTVINNSKMF